MVAKVVLLICALLCTCWAQGNVPLKRFNLNETNPLAICNDGSSGVVYYRPGTGSGSTSWVIRLQGGGWCWDAPSCASRAKGSPYWVTSNLCPDILYDNTTISGVGHEGILSSDPTYNPYFYNWNHVYVWYCSSDSHVGNVSDSTVVSGWHFMGKNIVHAVMTLITESMDLKSATNVLLTGDSAGGVATINNVDYIGEFVKAAAPSANYRTFVDCAWFLDIPAYDNPNFSFQMVAKLLVQNFNAIYDESCVQYWGPGNEWHCFHAQYAYPHLQTLAFYQEFQFDSANLGFDNAGYPFSNATQVFATNFQTDMLSLQANVPYLFSPNCYRHEVIDSTLFTSIQIGNVSISDAVGKWFNTPGTPAPFRTVDTCSGFNCNPTCPGL